MKPMSRVSSTAGGAGALRRAAGAGWRTTRHLAGIGGRVVRLSIQQVAAHRANLVFEAVLTLVRLTAAVAAVWAVFEQVDTLAGWTLGGAVILLGTYQIVTGLLDAFIEPNLSFFGDKVRQGTVDDILLLPVPSMFMASLGTCSPWALLRAGLGAVIVAVGAAGLGVTVNPSSVPLYLVQLGAGLVVAWAYRLALASASFWAPGAELSVLYNAGWQLGRYPVDVYPTPIRHLLTYVVPVAFVATYPARALVGWSGAAGRVADAVAGAVGSAGAALVGSAAASIVAATISMVLAGLVWRAGLRRYTSATS